MNPAEARLRGIATRGSVLWSTRDAAEVVAELDRLRAMEQRASRLAETGNWERRQAARWILGVGS